MASLRSQRLKAGLSQAQLAALVGVSKNTVARWERGELRPTPANAARLRAVLRAHPEPSREFLAAALAKAVGEHPEIPYAIGGADAMAVHGYRRHTADLDVFVDGRSADLLLQALAEQGLDVSEIFEHAHYVARIPGDADEERRIDVLPSWGEPELSAIEHAQVETILGRRLRVFSANLTTMTKFYAWIESGRPEYMNDVLELARRKLFDRWTVRTMIQHFDPDDLPRWDQLMAAADVPPRPRRPDGRPRSQNPWVIP